MKEVFRKPHRRVTRHPEVVTILMHRPIEMEFTLPRYFFDIRDNRGLHCDTVGDECRSFDEARDMAQTLLPDIVRSDLPDGELHTVTCEVRDEAGRTVYRGELTYRGTRDPA